MKLYSEGTREFDYYPFIHSGQFYEKRDKHGAYCGKREINANHPGKKNPNNVIPGYETFKINNGNEFEIWTLLSDEEKKIYSAIGDTSASKINVCPIIGEITVNTIRCDKVTSNKYAVIKLPSGGDGCDYLVGCDSKKGWEYWKSRFISFLPTLNYLTNKGIVLNPNKYYECSLDSNENLHITTFKDCSLLNSEAAMVSNSKFMIKLISNPIGKYFGEYYYPRLSMDELLKKVKIDSITYGSDSNKPSTLEEILNGLKLSIGFTQYDDEEDIYDRCEAYLGERPNHSDHELSDSDSDSNYSDTDTNY